MIEACNTLDFPVVSGNVSLYNETNGKGINPTPVIGGVGLIKDLNHFSTPLIKRENDVVILIGKTDGYLGQSIYAKEILNNTSGLPPRVNLENEKKIGDVVRDLINIQKIDTVHDISDGGLLIALAEMCIAGNIGVKLDLNKEEMKIKYLFGEDQGRYIISVPKSFLSSTIKTLEGKGIYSQNIGETRGKKIIINEQDQISIETLRDLHEKWFKEYMEG